MLIGFLIIHTMKLGPKRNEISSASLCEAVPFSRFEINGKAGIFLLVERAQAYKIFSGNFKFLNSCGVLGTVVHYLIKIYLSYRHAASTAILS